MRVMVCKTGSTWHGRGSSTGGSTLTSQHNHTAVARAVARAGHTVLCAGRVVGDLTEDVPGDVTVLPWAVRPELGVDGNWPQVLQFVRAAEAWRPDVLVNVVGSEQSVYTPENPRGNDPLDAGWRYGWTMMEMLRAGVCAGRRVVVVTDVRTYPREQDMVHWPECTPAAVLSQQDDRFERSMLGQRYVVHARYAGVERLRLDRLPAVRPARHARGCVALAHAHVKDARVRKGRDDVWRWIGARGHSWIDVWGEGWDDFPGEWPPALSYCGAVAHEEVQGLLHGYACGPLVAMGHGWSSPKYGEYARAGCLPLPYGRGREHLSYDVSLLTGEGHRVPTEATARFTGSDELWDLKERAERDYAWRCDQVDLATERSRPDPSLLLECVEHFGRGGAPDYARFGGYEPKERVA